MPYTYTYGSGTENDPYQVWTADDLDGIRDYCLPEYNGTYFKQMADIDLGVSPWIDEGTIDTYGNSGTGWVPIEYRPEGTHTTYGLNGVYDGNNFEIENLTMDRGDKSFGIGLFGSCYVDLDMDYDAPVFKNMIFKNPNVAGNNRLGVLIGMLDTNLWTEDFDLDNDSHRPHIINCHIKGGTITGQGGAYIGGMGGRFNNSGLIIKDSTVECTIIAVGNATSADVGGIVGQLGAADVINSHFYGNINFTNIRTNTGTHCNRVGGLIGEFRGMVSPSIADHEIIDSSFTGDIVISSDHGANSREIGGIIGIINRAGITIKRCVSIANIVFSGDAHIDSEFGRVGGLLGSCDYQWDGSYINIEQCFALGSISGSNIYQEVGGFIGEVYYGHIENCYSLMNVEGNQYVGGFIGRVYYDYLVLRQCYSAGQVNGQQDSGGFIGDLFNVDWIDVAFEILNCYFDSDQSGDSIGDGYSTPKTTAEMTYPYSDPDNVYIDWDFHTVWAHDKGGSA